MPKEEIKAPYVHQNYPTWRYSKTADPILVKDPAELASLGPEWFETPDCVPMPKKDMPEAAVVPPPDEPPKGDPADAYYKLSESQVVSKIEVALNALQLDVIDAMLKKEMVHPKVEGGRKNILKALKDASKTLERLR
jgi:hypothetical protein